MHVVIIGNGITGVSAAFRLRELDPACRVTLVSGESTYHFSRPALMYVFLGHMGYAETKPYEDHVWAERRIDLVRGWVDRVDTSARRLGLTDGRELAYDALLLATGSKPNRFGWPGEDLDGVGGLYSLMDLGRLYRDVERARHGVVVGGGLIGIELAEMLHGRGLGVTLLVRESSYWNNVLPPEESALVNAEIRAAGLDLRLSTELAEVVDDGGGRASAVVTTGGERIDCQVVGLTAGVSPNTGLARAAGLEVGRGIRVDASLRTGEAGVWAAGDCAEVVRADHEPLVEQVWYTGRAQGRLAAESILAGAEGSTPPDYAPGTWFNSAKFLDLEYQTYGRVLPDAAGQGQLVWSAGRRLLRLAHEDGRVVGFNAMGLRWRHRVAEAWIDEGREVPWVIEHLADAGFDGELEPRHEAAMAAELGRQYGAVEVS